MKFEELLESRRNIVSPTGIGNVPNNLDVDHFGIRVLMKPSTFLKLASPLQRSAQQANSVEYLANELRKGNPLGNPFFDVIVPHDDNDPDSTDVWRVMSHEGRHRMTAIIEVYGDVPVEVHFFYRRGWRGRDTKASWTSTRAVENQRGSGVVRNAIERFIR